MSRAISRLTPRVSVTRLLPKVAVAWCPRSPVTTAPTSIRGNLGALSSARSFHFTARRQEEVLLGSKNRLPEFSLKDKVIVVSGAGQGLGLVQAEALLEAGAIGTQS